MSTKFKRVISFVFSAAFVTTLMVTPASTAYINNGYMLAPEISQFEASGKYINADSQNLKVAYYLNEKAYITASILGDNGAVVNMIFANSFQTKGYNTLTWSGKNEDGNYVETGDYTLSLYANNDAGSYTYKYDFHVEHKDLVNDGKYKKDYYNPDNTKKYGPNGGDNNYSDPYNKNTSLIMQESGPYSFNPLQENFQIKFELNYADQVTVDILSTGQTVRTIMKNVWKESNKVYIVNWNGKNDSGSYVDQGKYKYRITLGNGDQYYGDVVVNFKGETPSDNGNYYYKNYYPGKDGYKYNDNYKGYNGYHDYNDYNKDGSLNVYGQKAEPSTFNPKSVKDETKISYNLSESAMVSVIVRQKSGAHVRYLIDNKSQSKGYHSVNFDGKDDQGKYLPEGTYNIQIKAKKSGQSDAESASVYIDYGIYSSPKASVKLAPKITNYKADPKYFDAGEEKTKITYHTNDSGYVTMKIMDGNKVITTLIDNDYKEKGDHAQLWNGKNAYNQYVPAGVYQFAIWFYNGKGDDFVKSNVEVDYSKYVGTYTDPYPTPKKIKVLADGDTYNYDYYNYNPVYNSNEPAKNCAGFSDVNESSKYCDAIKFAKDHKIFVGYNDGNFYPNKAIQRDEALKVVMETFNLSTMPADGSNLGFKDVAPDGWYVPYLKAAKYLGIISGYPNGFFKPYQSINRVEFTKVFVETAKDADGFALPPCLNKPYVDTPMTWYTDYVCYAKAKGLIKTVDDFHYQPSKLITRGEVAEFVYNYFGK